MSSINAVGPAAICVSGGSPETPIATSSARLRPANPTEKVGAKGETKEAFAA
jgi:hypothetical protein